MFGGTHEQKFASTLANFVHLSLSSYDALFRICSALNTGMPDIPVGAEQIAFFLETGTVAGQYKGSAVF